jgi:3-oxoacyl-[acyl-carrier-protein] synthase II
LALSDAGILHQADLLDRTDMIVAAGGGERDIAADDAILTGLLTAAERGAFLNERLMSDLRPTLFLAQLPNLLAGNISIVHGVVGSSRTFLGEESAGVDAVRIAWERIAAGQSELTLVGGAYNGCRWDILLIFEEAGAPLRGSFAPVGERGPHGGMALASLGAFLMLESREHAQERGARPRARITSVQSDRNRRRPGEIETTLRGQFDALTPGLDRAHAGIVSGATGVEPATSAERQVLGEIGLPVRATGTYIGHGFEAQFTANLAIACAALEHGKLWAPAGGADEGLSGSDVSQIVVTGVGNWRGEGLALLERVA